MCTCVLRVTDAHTVAFARLVAHPAGRAGPQTLLRARLAEITSVPVTKLRILHTGLTAAVTYLTFGQVARRVELECAPRKVFDIFVVRSRSRVCIRNSSGSGNNSGSAARNGRIYLQLSLHVIQEMFMLSKGTNHRARQTVSKRSRSEKCCTGGYSDRFQ